MLLVFLRLISLLLITICTLHIDQINSKTHRKTKSDKNSNFIREQADNLLFKHRLMIYEKIMDQKKKINKDEKEIDPIFQEYKESVMNEIIRRSNKGNFESQSNFLNENFSFLETSRSIPYPDSPNKFFTNSRFERNIENIPLKGSVIRKPWSGSYWPMRNGLIAVRYGKNDKNTIGIIDRRTRRIIREFNWTESVNMYSQPQEHFYQMRRNRTNYEKYIYNYYSPAEKYDLLVGDSSFALTKWNKDNGKKWSSEYKGDLPKWFGICHGWAPAAYELKNPIKAIDVTAADGRTKLTFFPDDIKALASLYWANVYYTTNFVGGICRVQKPKKPISDNATGLYLETPCHSINPAALIMIIGNHVGIQRKNLVLDPLSDPEVWNQPIEKYLFRYYNLITKDFSSSPSRVRIPISNIKNSKDPFLNFLFKQSDRRTKFVIGVYINITYTYETSPVHSGRPLDHFNKTDEFIAALQLDDDNIIIGGEWKYNAHPNFIWKADESRPVKGCCDHFVKNFTGRVNPAITRWATEASKKGQVIKSILDYLIELSADPNQNEYDKELDWRDNLPIPSQAVQGVNGASRNISPATRNNNITPRNRIERMETNNRDRNYNDLFDWVFS